MRVLPNRLLDALRRPAPPEQVTPSATLLETQADTLYRACPERDQALRDWYERPSLWLRDWLGPMPISVRASDDERRHRFDWQLQMAIEAVAAIDGVPTRAWADLHGEQALDWYRAVYWRALVAGLGRLYARHHLYADGKELDWMRVPVVANTTISLAYRDRPLDVDPALAEMAISNSVLGRIDPMGRLQPKVWLAYLDSWSRQPSEQNPLIRALLVAEQKMAALSARAGLDPEIAVELTKPVTTTTATTEIGHARPVVANGATTGPEIVQSERADATPARAAPEAPRYVRFLQALAEALAEGQLLANQKGALIHGTDVGPGLVVPALFDWWQVRSGDDIAATQQALDRAGLIDESASSRTHYFHLKGKGARAGKPRVRLLVLRGGMVRSWLSVPRNEDLLVE